MAGFVDNNRNNGVGSGNIFSRLKGNLRKYVEVGMRLDDKIIKNKLGQGSNETRARMTMGSETDIYFAALSDISPRAKYTAYDEKDYAARIQYLRVVSQAPDLDEILDTISDESIVYDDQNFFAKPDLNLLEDLDDELEEKVRKKVEDNFNYIYNQVFEFSNSTIAWKYFKQWLVEGYLAFELVFNDKQDKIIKAIPLDASTLKADIIYNNGIPVRVWIQNPEDSANQRIIYDTHIVYISYSKDGFTSRVSYVERLIRTFNLKRTIENTTVMWFLMNSTFRLKVIVPTTGSHSKTKEEIAKMASAFKEEVTVDDSSGEIRMDGNVGLNLYRNYILSSKEGKQTEIESMKLEGPDLSSPDILKYWENKLKKESKIPFNRFDKEGSTEVNIGTDATGQDKEEIRFERFINRLRSDFQDILIKPLIMQTLIDFPQFKEDPDFKSKIGIRYTENSMFREAKDLAIMTSRIDYIQKILALQDSDGKAFFPVEVLIDEYLHLDESMLQKIKDFKAKKGSGEATEGTTEGETTDTATEGGETSGEEPVAEEPVAEEPAA